MYIEGSITVGAQKLIWVKGLNAPSDISITSSTVTMDLDVAKGTPTNFTECLFLRQNTSTAVSNVYINTTTPVLSTDFQRAKVHIYDNSTGPTTWTYLDTFDLAVDNDGYVGNFNQAGLCWRLTFEVNATVASGTKSFDITVRY